MSYPLEFNRGSNRNKDRTTPNFIATLIIVVILTIGIYYIAPIIYKYSSGLWSIQDDAYRNLSRGDLLTKSKANLIGFINQLEQSESLLRIELMNAKVKAAEYERLVKIGTSTFGTELKARVIKRPPFSAYDTLVIDQGELQNIKTDMKVFFNQVYIGKVSKVFDTTAIITMISEPGQVNEIGIGNNGEIAKMEGLGGGSFFMEVPKDTNVKVGDEVTGLDRTLPVIGVVEHIDTAASETLNHVFVHFPFSLKDIVWLSIQN